MPGRIDTDRVRELDAIRAKATGGTAEAVKDTWARSIPLGRYGVAEEYGNTAVFLFSNAARYITGASIQCDGGMTRKTF